MFDKARYPENWRELRAAVQERAGNRCEHPGEVENCNAPNGVLIHRLREAHEFYIVCTHAEGMTCTDGDEWLPAIRVVLTTAHTCTEEPKCGNLEHLRFYCQLHHLNYDRRHHLAVQAANRERRKAAAS